MAAPDPDAIDKMHRSAEQLRIDDPRTIVRATPQFSKDEFTVRRPSGWVAMMLIGVLPTTTDTNIRPGHYDDQHRPNVYVYPYWKGDKLLIRHVTERTKGEEQTSWTERVGLIYIDPRLDPQYFTTGDGKKRWKTEKERTEMHQQWLLIVWAMCTGDPLPKQGGGEKGKTIRGRKRTDLSEDDAQPPKKKKTTTKNQEETRKDKSIPARPRNARPTDIDTDIDVDIASNPFKYVPAATSIDINRHIQWRKEYKAFQTGGLDEEPSDDWLRELRRVGKLIGEVLPRRDVLREAYKELLADRKEFATVEYTPSWDAWDQDRRDPAGAQLRKEEKMERADRDVKLAYQYLSQARKLDQNDPDVQARVIDSKNIILGQFGARHQTNEEIRIEVKDFFKKLNAKYPNFDQFQTKIAEKKAERDAKYRV